MCSAVPSALRLLSDIAFICEMVALTAVAVRVTLRRYVDATRDVGRHFGSMLRARHRARNPRATPLYRLFETHFDEVRAQ
jgi:hypothetical protein